MSVDLTEFQENDEVLVTYRAAVIEDDEGHLAVSLRWQGGYFETVPLECAIKAERVPPAIEPEGRYVDHRGDLYIGYGRNGWLRGPITSNDFGRMLEPFEVAKLRGLRPAVLRPVMPA